MKYFMEEEDEQRCSKDHSWSAENTGSADEKYVKMMDRALAMLIYDEYVPFPTASYRIDAGLYEAALSSPPPAPTCPKLIECPRETLSIPKVYRPGATPMRCGEVIKFREYSQPLRLGNITEEKTLEELQELELRLAEARLAEEMEMDTAKSEVSFSGWDLEMSFHDSLDFKPAIERQTLFLGEKAPTEEVHPEIPANHSPSYPQAGLFIRSSQGVPKPALSQSSFDDDWVIA